MDVSTLSDGALTRLGVRVLLPLAAFQIATLGVAYAFGAPVSDLLRDPSAVFEGRWYVGIYSTAGVALWAVAGAVCLLVLMSNPPADIRPLLRAGAVASILLAVDDGFVIHETLKLDLGVPAPLTFAVYGAVIVPLFWKARHALVSAPTMSVFWLALGFLGLSLGLDLAGELGLPTPPLSAILEDVAKFIGIATWTAFFGGICRRAIVELAAPLPDRADGDLTTPWQR